MITRRDTTAYSISMEKHAFHPQEESCTHATFVAACIENRLKIAAYFLKMNVALLMRFCTVT